jgi:hypothetical protein
MADRDALNLQIDALKKKLSRAPTWHLSADNCNRKALEAFMELYCLWYNDAVKTRKCENIKCCQYHEVGKSCCEHGSEPR